MMSKHIVTRESFQALITRNDEVALNAIGRALVHIFNRQTFDEKADDHTKHYNMRGFTPADARRGSITAKYYLKHRKLEDWHIRYWTAENEKGISRLAKYWRQINEEAQKKQDKTVAY